MATRIVITRDGRDPVEVDPSAPWSAREQVDWEQQFKSSFVTVFQAVGKDMASSAAALKAAGKDDDQEVDFDELEAADAPPICFQVTWMLFFAWHRLRASGDAPAKFDTFLNTIDYDFVRQPDPEPAAEPAQVAQEPLAAPAEQDGSLGPTQPIPEPAPAP
jgi:hypothetical protein